MDRCLLCNKILSEQEKYIDPDTGRVNMICYGCTEDPSGSVDEHLDGFWNYGDDLEDDYL